MIISFFGFIYFKANLPLIGTIVDSKENFEITKFSMMILHF